MIAECSGRLTGDQACRAESSGLSRGTRDRAGRAGVVTWREIFSWTTGGKAFPPPDPAREAPDSTRGRRRRAWSVQAFELNAIMPWTTSSSDTRDRRRTTLCKNAGCAPPSMRGACPMERTRGADAARCGRGRKAQPRRRVRAAQTTASPLPGRLIGSSGIRAAVPAQVAGVSVGEDVAHDARGE